MNINEMFTEKFNIKDFNIFLSDLFKQEITNPYDITFLVEDIENVDKINKIYEYKTFVDSEDEELKVYIIESENVFDSKKQRDELIKRYLKKSYINQGLVITFNKNSFPWIITYYKVRYVEDKKNIKRKISTDSKYSYTINEKPNEKLISAIEELIKEDDFLINSIYEIFENKAIVDINKKG